MGDDADVDAQQPPLALDPRQELVVLHHRRRVLAPPMRVEVRDLRRVLVPDRAIDVVEERAQVTARLVRDDDARPRAERHRHVAGEAAPLRAGEERGLQTRHAPEAEAEEVTERRRDGRRRRPIPVHVEPQATQHGRAAIVDRDPDASHHAARAREVQQIARLTGRQPEPGRALAAVVVRAGRTFGGAEVLGAGPTRLHAGRDDEQRIRGHEEAPCG